MKILVLNYEYPPLGGGGGIACQKLAEEYVRMGHRVDCVTTWYRGLSKEETKNGVLIHRIRVIGKRTNSTAGLLSLFSFPICAYKYTVELCKAEKFDCIHTHFSVPTGPLGVWISKRFNIPNVLSLHGGDVFDPTRKTSPHKWWPFRKCNEWVFNNTDYIVAQSHMTREKGEMYYRCSKKIDVIPLAHNPIAFQSCDRKELGLEDDKKYIISIGRLVKRKGFAFLIRTIRQLKDVNLIIIGDGPEKRALEELISVLGLNDRVAILGAKYGDEKFQYLSNSDIFVLSSIYEPFGIVLQEAMQVGLPIISTCEGGQSDLIEDKVNGLLINYGDEECLAEYIKYLLDNPMIGYQMGKKNIIKIQDYSAYKIAKKYLDIMFKMGSEYKKDSKGTNIFQKDCKCKI